MYQGGTQQSLYTGKHRVAVGLQMNHKKTYCD